MNKLTWPYDELKLETSDNPNEIILKLPWLQLKAKVKNEQQKIIFELKKKLDKNTLEPEDITHFSQFLSSFLQYPVYYILPQNKQGEIYKIKNNNLINKSPEQVLKEITMTNDSNLEAITSKNLESIKTITTRNEFKWSFEDAIQFANFEGQVHPESLLTVARRYYMIDVMEFNEVGDYYTKIKNLAEPKRSFAAATMVRQNHYVTQRCQKALTPALASSGSSKDKVIDFINEEQGHDHIIIKSLQSMGYKEEDIPVSLNTQCLMDMLYFTAKRNYLAFAIVIDFFERSSYSESDPLADLLIDSGHEKAATFINNHMHINEDGAHELISFELIHNMGLCSPEYAREALMIAELTSHFMNNLVQSTYNTHIKD